MMIRDLGLMDVCSVPQFNYRLMSVHIVEAARR